MEYAGRRATDTRLRAPNFLQQLSSIPYFDHPTSLPHDILPLPNADQFSSELFQDFTTLAGGSLSSEIIHQEKRLVYDPFSNIWDEDHLAGQMVTLHDRVHRYTFCFESPSPESHLAEGIPALVSNEMTTPHVGTLSPQEIESG